MACVKLTKGREGRILAGHPWIYEGEIDQISGNPAPGDIVDVLDYRGKFLGRGFINPASKITVRILTREDEPVDGDFFRKQLVRAREYRRAVVGEIPCYRAVFGEADFLPGLIIDIYEDVAVIQTLALGMDVRKGLLVELLSDVFGLDKVYERNDARSRELEGLPLQKGFLLGEFPTAFWIRENELQFWVDVESGQKTGYFLDQRENHRAIEPWCPGAKVLDVFCYTGGFALHAASYGAKDVVAVDSSRSALELAQMAASRNGLERTVNFIEGNAFDVLRDFEARGESFDLIIVDPPAFAPSKRTLASAVRGYKEINLRAMKLLPPGGVLVTCSCSYHITPEIFLEMLADAAADVGRHARLVEFRPQAKDHPVLLGVKETHYLKCAFLRIE